MKTIIAIVGPSGSGKSELEKFYEKNFNWGRIISYTTRQIRPGEINGINYHYITDSSNYLSNTSNLISYTKFGNNEYFALLSDLESKDIWLYVVEESGLLELKSNSNFNVISIYIDAPVSKLLLHGVSEERIQRDRSRAILSMDNYDYILLNTSNSLEDFLEDSRFVALKILRRLQNP